MQSQEQNEIEIDLKEIFLALLNKIWPILLTGIVGAAGAFLVTKLFMSPVYESTSSVYVLNRQNAEQGLTTGDLSSASQLTKDFEAMVTKRSVLEKTIEELGLDMDYKELAQKISVNNPTDTRVLEITAEDTDPVRARDIANAVRENGSEEMVEIMMLEGVNVVEEANLPDEPSRPSAMKNTLLGGLAGLFLACAVVIVRFLLDDTIKSEEDVERYLELSVLGVIPDADGAAKAGRGKMGR